MLTLHHLNDSRSQRILWLLEELSVPYEMKRYQRDATTRLAPPELKKIHPLGKSPVITDGNVTIAESAAIVDYIIRRYGRLIDELSPLDRKSRLLGGRRNIYIWILALGLLLGAPARSFVVIAYWEMATAALQVLRAIWAIWFRPFDFSHPSPAE